MAVKMADIAREAGVSIGTVGRVLHCNGYVSQEARKRVEAAVSRLGYVPNVMARALKSQKSGIIGCLAMENVNGLFQRINSAFTQAAEQAGYQIVTMLGRSGHRDEEKLIDQFTGLRVDGLAVISNKNLTGALFDKLRARGIPVVAVERTYSHPHVDNLSVRDREGCYQAAECFLQKGHRRVAAIAAGWAEPVEAARREGFRQALCDWGVPRERQLVQTVGQYRLEEGRAAMEALLALDEPPTGVFCTADTLAAGAMQAIYQAGRRVPEDFSIAGYDNVLAAQLAPAIDSVDLDMERIGERIVSILRRRMEAPAAPAIWEELDTVYISRGTVASPKASPATRAESQLK